MASESTQQKPVDIEKDLLNDFACLGFMNTPENSDDECFPGIPPELMRTDDEYEYEEGEYEEGEYEDNKEPTKEKRRIDSEPTDFEREQVMRMIKWGHKRPMEIYKLLNYEEDNTRLIDPATGKQEPEIPLSVVRSVVLEVQSSKNRKQNKKPLFSRKARKSRPAR